jgi:hypothetical protein
MVAAAVLAARLRLALLAVAERVLLDQGEMQQ